MNEYLLRIKVLVDGLVAIGLLISVEEHIEAIFEGFLVDYDPFIASVNTRLEPYMVGEIEALLFAQEV